MSKLTPLKVRKVIIHLHATGFSRRACVWWVERQVVLGRLTLLEALDVLGRAGWVRFYPGRG